MASSRKTSKSGSKSDNSNDILHILAIIFLVIVICIIIYLIYKTLKGKGEFFEIMNTIEHFQMTLSSADQTAKPYKEQQLAFKYDLNKHTKNYDESNQAASSAFSAYNTEYNNLKVEELQKRLTTINSSISTINTQINNVTDSASVEKALGELNKLITSLAPLQEEISAKQRSAENLKTQNSVVSGLLLKASNDAQTVITDIDEGNKINQAFTANYANTIVQPRIKNAKTALEQIVEGGGITTEEKEIITSSRKKLQATIDSLTKLVKDASEKLDNSSYIATKNNIDAQKNIIDQNKKDIDSYLSILNGLLEQLKTIENSCKSYQTNLPLISNALQNMSTLITNSSDLTTFMSGL